MKRLIIALLSLTIALAPALASCANNPDLPVSPTTAIDDGEGGGETTTNGGNDRLSVSDDLAPADFGGKEFRILYRNGCARANWQEVHRLEVEAESETGDVVNDAVYARNLKVEERFNVKIRGIAYPAGKSDEGAVASYVKKTIQADANEFDAVITWSTQLAPVAAEGYLYDWYSVPNINLSKPWWIKDAIDAYSVGGRSFLAMSDLTYQGAIGEAAFMMFNKNLIRDYALEDPYKLVEENKWTMDKLAEIARSTYKDVNGDGERDDGDIYGFASDAYGSAYAFLWSCGSHLTNRDSTGMSVLDMGNEKAFTIADKVYSLFYESPGSFIMAPKPTVKINTKTAGFDQGQMFADGKVVYLSDRVGILATPPYRNTNVNYGVLPMPKLDESQPKYLTMVNEHAGALALPINNTDVAMAGTIIEALSAESYRRVVPAYYEIALKVKYSQDEQSVRMLDLILDGRVFDFGLLYNIKGFDALQTMMGAAKPTRDFASYVAKNTGSAEKQLAKVIDQYANLS